VYILRNNIDKYTYVGYTNDPYKRIKRHNGELSGGAKFTTNRKKRTGCTWSYMTLVEPVNEFSKNMALSLEWHIKHKNKCTRNEALVFALAKDKFKDFHFVVYTFIEEFHCFADSPNVEVRDIHAKM
jgi:predicted GIY-YIG superfamily endonuclease